MVYRLTSCESPLILGKLPHKPTIWIYSAFRLAYDFTEGPIPTHCWVDSLAGL